MEYETRMLKASLMTRLMRKPELGAVSGLIIILLFFITVARPEMFGLSGVINFMELAAQLGILALGAALLMIGGEFDLSIGSMAAFIGFIFTILLVEYHQPFLVAVVLSVLVASVLGALNGQIVVRTGLPSFIVTLAFLFILRGLSLVGLKWQTGGMTQIRIPSNYENIYGSWFVPLFTGETFTGLFSWLAENDLIAKFPNGLPKVTGIPVEIIWFILLAFFSTFLLKKTSFGNWIFAAGGDPVAARNSCVPVARVKTILFVITAVCATIYAIITTLDAGSIDAKRGFLKEFESIIAAVIGGCLLTGGYGSTIGAFFGAIIFGMVSIGLTYTDIDQDWYQVFLGLMLLVAVLFNNMVRSKVTGGK